MTIGYHLVMDLYLCANRNLLSSDAALKETLGAASRRAGATVRSFHSHEFTCKDTGAPAWSVMVILEESHCAAHCWPKEQFVSLDIYTCGKTDPMSAVDYLLKMFQPKDYTLSYRVRGDKLVA